MCICVCVYVHAVPMDTRRRHHILGTGDASLQPLDLLFLLHAEAGGGPPGLLRARTVCLLPSLTSSGGFLVAGRRHGQSEFPVTS